MYLLIYQIYVGCGLIYSDIVLFKIFSWWIFANKKCLSCTVNQQILAAIKFGVSQNKVIWRLLNLASLRLCSVRWTSLTYVGGDKY